MNSPLKNLLAVPKGMLLYLALCVASFPVILVESRVAGHSSVLHWLGLNPSLLWKGQVWRLWSYEWLNANVGGWVMNVLCLATLISILRNDWTSRRFWLYALVAGTGGALPLLFLFPKLQASIASTGAVVCALLIAWDHIYRHERIIMLGLGEISVRQAALSSILLSAVITYFSCGGWPAALSMLCGGATGWLFLRISRQRLMIPGSRVMESQRAARLEL